MEENKRDKPQNGELYRHFTGNLYQIAGVAIHSETEEELVIYQALYGTFGLYARPLSMFMEELDRSRYRDTEERYCFTRVMQGELEQSQTRQSAEPMIRKEIKTKPEVKTDPESDELDFDSFVILQERKETDRAREGQEAFLRFLDAETYQEKLEVLYELKERLNRRLLDSLAVAMDLTLEGKDEEKDYELLLDHVRTRVRYDGNRLR